ncbi:AraC family transcriptional regulator [Photobacterium sp. SDRW27]|uniref:helix-turn-helix domain-containing protein n=1 Tax=Photobacterium obscurum TaxID=2829490 RepID=UPI002242D23B|nr:AraC family transcriptional regulator [Photobacterium obscurum]MCW8327628.1 AraC family transcriptional regulator [Photobacterium obscurum]
MLRKATELPLTNSIILLPFLGYYEESGFNQYDLLKGYGLNPQLIRPDNYIPSFYLCNIINDVSVKTRIDNIGITASKLQGYPSIHPTVAANIPKAESFFDLFLFLSKNQTLQGSHFKLWLTYNNDICYICHKGQIPYHALGPEQTEYFRTLTLLNVLKSFLGHDWKPEALYFVSPLAPPHGITQMTSSLKVYTNQSYGCIPVNIKLDDIAEKIALSQLSAATDPTSFERLIMATETFIEHRDLSLPFLSEVFGCSQRSLQRILKSQGSSFQTITKQLKFKRAKSYLEQDMSIEHIATKLGYSDPSNFTRAFKKHTGHAPSFFHQHFDR